MIGAEEIKGASVRSDPKFAEAAGIDTDAVHTQAERVSVLLLAQVLGLLKEGAPLDFAVRCGIEAAWCQAFTAGVIAAREEAAS